MSFFKRLTRSRSNSYDQDDYADAYHQAQQQQHQQHPDSTRPPSSWKYDQSSPAAHAQPQAPSPTTAQPLAQTQAQTLPDGKIYNSSPQMAYHSARSSGGGGGSGGIPSNGGGLTSNGIATNRSSRDGFVDVAPQAVPQAHTESVQPLSPTSASLQAPDLLARAFHESVRPYTDKIEALEQNVADLQTFVDQLEQQRLDFFAWIDKRGLRSEVPPSIAKQMDTSDDAADALNGQLDRKITIVNFDLHRLQDDLNDSISSAHFAASMAKFLPDIQRLANLPKGGPRYAYDLIIKVVGNLNSHGGDDAAEDAGDRDARDAFYRRMDAELIEVIRLRGAQGEHWDVGKEVRRFERNAQFLKQLGIETYFPRSLEVMRTAEAAARR